MRLSVAKELLSSPPGTTCPTAVALSAPSATAIDTPSRRWMRVVRRRGCNEKIEGMGHLLRAVRPPAILLFVSILAAPSRIDRLRWAAKPVSQAVAQSAITSEAQGVSRVTTDCPAVVTVKCQSMAKAPVTLTAFPCPSKHSLHHPPPCPLSGRCGDAALPFTVCPGAPCPRERWGLRGLETGGPRAPRLTARPTRRARNA